MRILDKNNFNNEISSGIVLVDMYADWCGPCRALAPILESLDGKFEGVVFAKLNVDENQSVASEYDVYSIPTVIIFKDGKEVKRLIGLYPRERYEGEIRAVMNS